MTEPPVGVRLTERLRGTVAGAHLDLTVTAVIALPDDSEPAPARVVGHVDHDPWGGRVPLADGRLVHEGDALVYRARARVRADWVDIEARRELADDDGLDAWADATTVEFSASSGESGRLRLGPLDAARALASAEPVAAHGALDRAGALARLARTGLRRALATY
jgi:hypothetical protein